MDLTKIPPDQIILGILISIWTLFWKGIALWRSAQGKQNKWFIAFLLLFYLNLFAIVEIIYLFKFAKNKLTLEEMKSWLPKSFK